MSAEMPLQPDRPDLSLIIPVYNLERLLAVCLDSILFQCAPLSFEVLVVDDGSTDQSLALARNYAGRFPNVKVLTQPNAGVGVARNTGLAAARGRFVWFVDSDDRLTSDAFLKLWPVLSAPDPPDVLLFQYTIIETGTGQRKPMWEIDRNLLARARARGPVSVEEMPELLNVTFYPWFRLYRREFIEENGIRFAPTRVNEDMPFVIGAMVSARRIEVLPETLYLYMWKRPEGQAYGMWDERRLDLRAVYEQCDALCRERSVSREALVHIWDQQLRFLFESFRLIRPDLKPQIKTLADGFIRRFTFAELQDLWRQSLLDNYDPGAANYLFDRAIAGRFQGNGGKPLLTVILPVREEFDDTLLPALRTLARQDDLASEHYEVLLTGRADRGANRDLCRALSRNDSRFTVPAGTDEDQARAWARGLELAQGEYVCFLEPGTWLRSFALKKLLGTALMEGADLVKADFDRADRDGHLEERDPEPWATLFTPEFKRRPFDDREMAPPSRARELLEALPPGPGRTLFRTDLARRLATERPASELFAEGGLLLERLGLQRASAPALTPNKILVRLTDAVKTPL